MEKLPLIKNSSGQTILEAVIALAALLLVLSASSVAIVTSVNNATFTRNQNQANKLAQAGMEEVRSIKNTDYTDFRDNLATGTKCLNGTLQFSTSGQDCTVDLWAIKPNPSTNFRFIREVQFIQDDTNECILNANPGVPGSTDKKGTKVRVNVRWSSGKCSSTNLYCHNSYVESCFFPPL